MKIRHPFLVVMIVLACLFQSTGVAQQNIVTKVVAIARSKSYTGPCPLNVDFLATIFVSRPAKVEYRWERSDGTVGPREFVDIRGSGKGVTTTWRVGSPRRSFSVGERLRVLAPNAAASDWATVKIKCN